MGKGGFAATPTQMSLKRPTSDFVCLFLNSVLSKKHFVDQHKEQLIQQVSSVDKVLGLLSIDVLSPDEYQFIMAEGTDRERMQKLYKMVLRWNTVSKDQLYWALKKTNQNLITELQGNNQT